MLPSDLDQFLIWFKALDFTLYHDGIMTYRSHSLLCALYNVRGSNILRVDDYVLDLSFILRSSPNPWPRI